MTYANLLIRPDLGYKAYRLHCRFTICAFPTKGQLEGGKLEAGYRFIEDMDKQGYEYIDSHGVKMSGP